MRQPGITAIVFLGIVGSISAADRCLHFYSPLVPKDSKDPVLHHLKASRLSNGAGIHPYRGSAVVRLKAMKPFGGYPAYIEIYPGPPHLTFRIGADWPKDKKGKVLDQRHLIGQAQVALRYRYDSNVAEQIKTGKGVKLKPGDDLHVVWTWSGVEHRLYLNGQLGARRIASSPFPRKISSILRILSNGPDLKSAPVHEVALYNFAMTAEQVAQDLREKDATPLLPTASQRPTVIAQWAPGELKVYAAADTGDALEAKASTVRFQAYKAGKRVATKDVALTRGFAEAVIDVLTMPPGKYHVEAVFRNAKNKKLATAVSDRWELPRTKWLRNTLGITDKVQPPWTPIRRKGSALEVWGRDLELKGGFGLPQQITSQKRAQLKKPIALEIICEGNALGITDAKVRITKVKDHVATWEGKGLAGDVRVQVNGTLEYDGMVLLKLRLAPRTKGTPVKLDAIRLHTVMPKERALFMNTSTDQGYWWYPYKGWVPKEPGVVYTNLKQKPAATNFLFFVLFCDHDTGLEWFADNLAGWQVNDRKVVQEIVREQNGDVRLTCHLANQPFVLDRPITITFGYEATPVKPLPKDWRSAYVHYAKLPIQSELGMWWLWTDSRFTPHRPGIFTLRPNNLAGFAQVRAKTFKTKLAPFTNQHVTVPAWPENQAKDKGWGWLHNLLQAESANDGWTAMPTRGIRDYWAWNLDAWIKSGGMEAIYIDEAGTQTVHASLLTGSGYQRPDGTHGEGHNTLGMRQQLKRIRQLFIDNGKRPLVWIPVYGKYIPHAYAFVDVVSEGEAFMFEKPDGPDWIDNWGGGLLGEPGTPSAKGAGSWLLGYGAAQKFGFIPVFLDYIKFWNKPEYRQKQRAMYGLLGLLDIIPIKVCHTWFFQAKDQFGAFQEGTTFHRYFEQKAIVAERNDVKISYYKREDGVLAIITNLGKTPYEKTPAGSRLRFDLKALGLDAAKLKVELLDEDPKTRPRGTESAGSLMRKELLLENGILKLTIPPHDFRMIEVKQIVPASRD